MIASALDCQRSISRAFLQEILELLWQRRHVALLAPRQSGKALVLFEAKRLSQIQCKADRPRVVILRAADFRNIHDDAFDQEFAKVLSVQPDVLSRAIPLGARLLMILRKAVKAESAPLWLFFQNLTELRWPIARGLLQALQEAAEESDLRQMLSVIITGGQAFIPLTYSENSPYRHATQLFLTGLDRELALLFFQARVEGRSLHAGFEPTLDFDRVSEIDETAADLLWKETGGYARFIEEIVLTGNRLSVLTGNRPIAVPHRRRVIRHWTEPRVRELIHQFVSAHLEWDPYCRLSLREVERDPAAWELLQKLVANPESGIAMASATPHLLETSGIARRNGEGQAFFASPIWRRFLEQLLDRRHRADVYAQLRMWDKAWEFYRGTQAANCERVLDGEASYSLDRVIQEWEASLTDLTAHGAAAVFEHFQNGARDLFGFISVSLKDRWSIHPGHDECTEESRLLSELAGGTADFSDTFVRLVVFPGRLCLHSSPQACLLPAQIGIDPCLELKRDSSREVDSSTIALLRRSLHRFWLAFVTAKRVEYDRTIGELREKHLRVMERVNALVSLYPSEMHTVVQKTADALVEIGGYYRILICLISPGGDRIQAVASRCRKPEFEFDYETNYPLDVAPPDADWDIQQWVAIKGRTAVADASDPAQVAPRTNARPGQRIGMKGIAVVPILLKRFGTVETLGTLHFEREDKRLPSQEEQRLFEILASRVAVAFDQARRMTMLEQAIQELDDDICILSRDRRVVFRNHRAEGVTSTAWQFPISASSRSDPRQYAPQVDNSIADLERPTHFHIRRMNKEKRRVKKASDVLFAPIRDFRSELSGVFRADGKIGFLRRTHNLTPLVHLFEALQSWLGAGTSRESARRILDYFRRFQVVWCRLYLYRKDQRGDEFLESFEEYGIPIAANRQKFRDGKFRLQRSDPNQQAWFLIDHLQCPAIFRHDETLQGKRPVLESERGIPIVRTYDQWRHDFAKSDPQWIEAPLLVGQELVGLVALSSKLEVSPLLATQLQWCVGCIAISLRRALRAEHEIARAEEEAWRSAAQLAVHQLTNKLVPVESSCRLVSRKLAQLSEESDAEVASEISLLNMAEQGLRTSREILKDFRKYASNEPASGVSDFDADDLLRRIDEHLRWAQPEVKITTDHSVPPGFRIATSLPLLLEVFEVLLENSVRHSGKKTGDLEIAICIQPMERPDHSDKPVVVSCKLIYRDNGSGILEPVRARIFEPFFTTNPLGNGLGLAIARRIMLRLGGEIKEEGVPGTGARFCIQVPGVLSSDSQGTT